MAFDNTVTVVGNVTRDPELRFTQGGMAVANFGVAWNKKRNDGEDEVSFFDVTCFRQLAENVADSIAKGARVVVYGMISQRSWENQQGERRSKVEIVADDVAPSLKWASAEITRNEFRGGSDGAGRPSGGGARSQSSERTQPQPTYDLDEEPF
ncbi:MAG: single-stranded DNA-binding protein [Acidimicrobiaceae bacterium]|nr:single-stranded DNA-binding protein [Acidimicrobiaceae bacterium]